MEFDNVLRTPYTGPFNSALVSQNPFPPATPSAFSLTPQNSAPPAVSSFSQLGSSLNTGLGTRHEMFLPFELLSILMEIYLLAYYLLWLKPTLLKFHIGLAYPVSNLVFRLLVTLLINFSQALCTIK